jgi:hypothetical protein
MNRQQERRDRNEKLYNAEREILAAEEARILKLSMWKLIDEATNDPMLTRVLHRFDERLTALEESTKANA